MAWIFLTSNLMNRIVKVTFSIKQDFFCYSDFEVTSKNSIILSVSIER